MWDERYDRQDYLFGKAPAAFLADRAEVIPEASRVLCVADGEGRNSVYLAGLGHLVTAFDASGVAVEKARKLAKEAGVEVDFNISGIEDWDWSSQFDAAVGIFIQFVGPDLRATLFDNMARAVRPGGLLILHGYAPRQVENGTGGPPQRENMYTESMLAKAFAGWEIARSADYDAVIDEGPGHSGQSALIDFIARKPA